MVFDWKTVPADEKLFKKLHFMAVQQSIGTGVKVVDGRYELKVNDWLKYELRWFNWGYKLYFAVVRKVHKKAQYPAEWFEYPKERENELFAAKMKKMLDDLSNRVFVAEAIEAAMMLVNNANYYAGILSQIWAVLKSKNQNSATLMVYEPTLRVVSDAVITYGALKAPLENGEVYTDIVVISTDPPLMPLSWLLGLPFLGRNFIPVVWVMQYAMYYGSLLMMRVPQNYVNRTEEIAPKVIYMLYSGLKEPVIRDQIRMYPVRAELLKGSVYPTAQVQLFVSDRGIFFETPPEYEWYVALTFDMPRADATYLINMGARDYLSLVNMLFPNI